MDHIKWMSCIGYENNKVGIQSLARDYTVSLRKNIKGKDSSMGPYSAIDGFMDFWADCGILKFQNHNHLRWIEKCQHQEKKLKQVLHV